MNYPPEHSGGDCPNCNTQGSLSYFRAPEPNQKPIASCAICRAQFGGNGSVHEEFMD